MKEKKTSFEIGDRADCLWLFLEKKRGEIVFSSPILRDLDWKSRGFLSRVVRDETSPKQTVFLSVGDKLPLNLCAIDTVDSFNPEHFEANVKGTKAQKLVILFENSALKEEIYSKMSRAKMSHVAPECIFIEDQA